MNIHVGIWNFDGKEIDGGLLARLRNFLKSNMAGEIRLLQKNSLAILYDASGTNAQPVAGLAQENRPWIFWDGRLDNRGELEMRASAVSGRGSDSDLLRETYEREGVDAFSQIIGDWAICCVCEARRDLVLARDFVGARTLFYRIEKNSVMWSSAWKRCSSPQMVFPNCPKSIWRVGCGLFPEAHRTPYRDIFRSPRLLRSNHPEQRNRSQIPESRIRQARALSHGSTVQGTLVPYSANGQTSHRASRAYPR